MEKKDLQDLNKTMKEHGEMIYNLAKDFKDFKTDVKPMVDSYKTATTIGGWFWKIMVFISLTVGIIIGLKDVFKN